MRHGGIPRPAIGDRNARYPNSRFSEGNILAEVRELHPGVQGQWGSRFHYPVQAAQADVLLPEKDARLGDYHQRREIPGQTGLGLNRSQKTNHRIGIGEIVSLQEAHPALLFSCVGQTPKDQAVKAVHHRCRGFMAFQE